MKHISFNIFFAILLVFLFTSCEYEPKGEYYKDIKPPDSAIIQIALNPQKTSYVISGVTNFSCTAFTFGHQLYSVKFYIDSIEINESADYSSGFIIDSRNYPDGIHILTIVVTTGSSTGSIADIIGAEGFIYSQSWNLIVDNSPPVPVQITGINDAGGLLKIEWNKYSKGNFSRYEVLKTINYTSNVTKTYSMAFIDNMDRNFFYDSSYMGGYVEYVIRVKTTLDLSADSDKKSFSDDIPLFKLKWIKDDIMEISWDRFKYYKAFKKMIINPTSQGGGILIDNLDTTVVQGNFGIFGHESSCVFKIETNKSSITGFDYYSAKNTIGYPFPKNQKILKTQVGNIIFAKYLNKLYKYNTITRQIIDSVQFQGFNPEFILSPLGDVLLMESPFSKIDPETYNIIAMPNLLINSENLSLSSYGIASTTDGPALYDFKNFTIVSPIVYTPELYPDKYISEDNKYLFVKDSYTIKCFSLEGGQLSFKWETPKGYSASIPGNPDKIIVTSGKILKVIDVATNQLIISFSTETDYFLDVDSFSKLVMYAGTDFTLDFYNYETGQKVKSIRSALYGNFIHNGIIYSSEGNSLPILD
jgi:hypothetical protein